MTVRPSFKQRLRRLAEGDLVDGFLHSKGAMAAALVIVVMVLAAAGAAWIAPQDPYDLVALDPSDAFLPPAWLDAGRPGFLLGTDDQGRDLLSAILYGTRVSLLVGVVALGLAMVLGITLGLVSGYVGGAVDAVIMRIADVQLSLPAILVAMLVDGLARGAFGRAYDVTTAVFVMVLSIALSLWVHFARTVRAMTLAEREKEYVLAASLIGQRGWVIMLRHILPNLMGPVLVIATINLAIAVVTEATLSFLGLGLPPTQPSLGTLIRTGNDFLFSGEWWMVVFPGLTLAALILSFNLVGDWLRDVLDPRLRNRA